MAKRRHRDLARLRAAEVDHDQAERAADGGVGAKAGAEHARRAVDAEAPAHGAIDDDEGRGGVGGAGLAVEVEGGIAGGLDHGQHHGEIIRPAACHDRVDGELLDGGSPEVRWHLGHQRLARPPGRGQHALHALAGGRDHGEPIGDAALEPDLEIIGHGGAWYTESSNADPEQGREDHGLGGIDHRAVEVRRMEP